jgi:trehalose synthase
MPKRRFQLKAPKLKFSEQFYPARPKEWLKKARQAAKRPISNAQKIGLPLASNPVYIRWLKKESMLQAATRLSLRYSGQGSMWQKPYAKPRPRTAVNQASVWYTAYPASNITAKRQTLLGALGNDKLWKVFEEIGIKGLHTGPMKRAGGVKGWEYTPSIDGHFDRISTEIDPVFGTEDDFRKMTATAAKHGGIVIDDIVPGHTGKGADFRLAEMRYADYPGIYHMVEVEPKDWHLLPEVPKGKDSVNLSEDAEAALKEAGYIIGKLQRIIFYEPGVKETNWSATKAVRGVDNIKRRWVYLHYFKDGQPSLNWLDPSFAGMKLVIGDALHSLGELGSQGLRLDANGFLGLEKGAEDEPAWSEGHPLSGAANQLITSMVRKVGGFTFQELNLSYEDIKTMSDIAADLSYDFVNRTAYYHAITTGDTEFLRLTLRTALKIGLDPASLVHALQNHDELNYELVHFWTVHKDDTYKYHGKNLTGEELRAKIREDICSVLLSEHASFNAPFTDNGIAATTGGMLAAVVGASDLNNLSDAEIAQIKRMHLLLAAFNALQPGVFALSGWDLSGALNLDKESVRGLIADGDTRWLNRGAYDLLGENPDTQMSDLGMPRATCLYGDLPTQLKDPESFASQLKNMLAHREAVGIATSFQIDIPDVSNKSVLAMLHQLVDDTLQMSVLNFSDEVVEASITSKYLPSGGTVTNIFTNHEESKISWSKVMKLSLQPYQYLSLIIEE